MTQGIVFRSIVARTEDICTIDRNNRTIVHGTIKTMGNAGTDNFRFVVCVSDRHGNTHRSTHATKSAARAEARRIISGN